jgi:hypothetical protein
MSGSPNRQSSANVGTAGTSAGGYFTLYWETPRAC